MKRKKEENECTWENLDDEDRFAHMDREREQYLFDKCFVFVESDFNYFA